MKNHESIDEAIFEASWPERGIALVRIKRHVLSHASILCEKEAFFGFLDRLAEDSETRCVVLMGNPNKRGTAEFEEWFAGMLSARDEPNGVQRVVNAFQQFVRRILMLPQVVLYGDAGTMTMNYLSAALVSNYVVLAENVCIQNPNARFDVLPAGGCAWLLRERLGPLRALALLASVEDITAEEALALGLCQAVCAPDELEDKLMRQARAWAQHRPGYLRSLKAVMRQNLPSLEAWFLLELEGIVRDALWH